MIMANYNAPVIPLYKSEYARVSGIAWLNIRRRINKNSILLERLEKLGYKSTDKLLTAPIVECLYAEFAPINAELQKIINQKATIR